jgi:GNAT superfamily N-acetyltransferase
VRQSRKGRSAPRSHQSIVALRTVEVVRTYLELRNPADLRGVSFSEPRARVERRSPCAVPLYRRLYKEVGEDWYWHDRLEWSDEALAAHLARPDVAVFELMVGDESAGYFELGRHGDGSVEIVYFGLNPRFIGKGLGGPLLSRAVEEGWKMSASRVWLHTCTLDSERALPNYRARGFLPFKTERLEVDIEGKHVVSERLL